VVFAEPHARLYTGLKPGVDRAEFVRSLEQQRVEECLHSYHVHPGDCLFIPAGAVHAIGEGVVLAEIQQTSDVTFRIDDWGRLDASGKPRGLHIKEALQCIDFERGPVDPVTPQAHPDGDHEVENLVACNYFELRRHRLTSSWRLPQGERFRILMPLEGRVDVQSGDWRQTLGLGATLLIPACLEDVSAAPHFSNESCASESAAVLEAFVR
jgi:mannose-6-phosphate isomerase